MTQLVAKMAERRQANILSFFTDKNNSVRKRPLSSPDKSEERQPKEAKEDEFVEWAEKVDCDEMTNCDESMSDDNVANSQSNDDHGDDVDDTNTNSDDRRNDHDEDILVDDCEETDSEAKLSLQKVKVQTKLWRKDFY